MIFFICRMYYNLTRGNGLSLARAYLNTSAEHVRIAVCLPYVCAALAPGALWQTKSSWRRGAIKATLCKRPMGLYICNKILGCVCATRSNKPNHHTHINNPFPIPFTHIHRTTKGRTSTPAACAPRSPTHVPHNCSMCPIFLEKCAP